ncbi:MAG: ABC transporter ATP-binding protein [Deltaproteobacteria bacterium]|nr:ABC transporter ATP-binding protein [Deltaproteobacteria bacterium]
MSFGGLQALDRVDLDIKPREIVALIGPNGAGKTTLFNCITGMHRATAGEILFRREGGGAERLNRLKPNEITERGMARTFQNIRIVPYMTALENVMIGRHCRTSAGILGAIFRGRATRAEEADTVSRSYELLRRVGLAHHAEDLAANLPYGAQRRLEIARALATEPRLLLLDEPAAGLNPHETAELDALIQRIRSDAGISILLIEHDMRLVMSISDRAFVLDYGRKIAQGSPQEIRNDPAVIKAYLGEEPA